MKSFTIIAGVNGTGKSSLAGVLKTERNDLGYIIDVDKIAFKKKCSPLEAGKIAVNKIDELLLKGISITQETTLSGQRTEKTVRAAKENGYALRLFYIGLNSYEESIKRIKNRVEKGGHDIDEKTVIKRFNNRFDSLLKILPYFDEAYFFDNENGFTEVAEFKNGSLIKKNDFIPLWIDELTQMLGK